MAESSVPWKKIGIGLGVVALVGMCMIAVAVVLLQRAAENFVEGLEVDLPALAEEGVRFAATHEQPQCVSEGVSRAVQCGALDMGCVMAASVFGQSCLDAALPDPAVCADVPESAGSVELSEWAQQQCDALGHSDGMGCVLFFTQSVGSYCLQQAGTH